MCQLVSSDPRQKKAFSRNPLIPLGNWIGNKSIDRFNAGPYKCGSL